MDPKRRDEFEQPLTLLFYRGADLVYDLVEWSEYDGIREELVRFDDY